ncbi:hypothetical protein [Saccharothrix obliqua]|uniref:hypothetical protein n=1 Tax=Saccharothrix obliqua TaxID=2861747 RepID=UPI001C607C2E|nr:hypothetical protein [Saccharothrix obliqua]MBW4719652.1 hypothetical protein [Saccharothrix obliqua]
MSDDRYGNRGDDRGRQEAPPSSLGEKVDWMAFSHQALYDMVHTGVDLNAAGSAQAEWASVGKALGEVRDLLAKAISQSQQAWSGASADRAREALETVEKWALNTSDHAENVAKCIGDEIQHVQTAREMMPAPVPAPPVVEPVGTPPPDVRAPLAEVHPGPRRVVGDGLFEPVVTPEVGPHPVPANPFVGAERVAAPVVDSAVNADATHRQAAEVMAMFQQNSYAVDRTVPSFVPPPNPVAPTPPPVVVVPRPGPAPVDGPNGPVVVTNPNQPASDQRAHQPAQQSSRGGRGPGGGGFGGGGRGRLPTPISAGGGGGGGGAPAPLGVPGSVSGSLGGAAEPGARSAANQGSVTSQFQGPKAVAPHGGMIGAPMPPPVAPQGGGANERNRPGYLEDDDNVFGVDRKAAPPVIGL